MSLTYMLKSKTHKEFQDILKAGMPGKESYYTLSGKSPFSKDYQLLSKADFRSIRGASLAGIAFGYLARLMIAKRIGTSGNCLGDILRLPSGEDFLQPVKVASNQLVFTKVNIRHKEAMMGIKTFLEQENARFLTILKDCIILAKLEQIVRSGVILEDLEEDIFHTSEEVLEADLVELTYIFIERFLGKNLVKPDSRVVFNPHFGSASLLVGGADADIYVDGTLYDFKTGRTRGYRWQETAQLFGYFMLAGMEPELAGIHDHDAPLVSAREINSLAFYRARYGEVEKTDLEVHQELSLKKTRKALFEYLQKEQGNKITGYHQSPHILSDGGV